MSLGGRRLLPDLPFRLCHARGNGFDCGLLLSKERTYCIRNCTLYAVNKHARHLLYLPFAPHRAERRGRAAPGVQGDVHRVHAHLRRRRRALGAAAGVGVVGVGLRELGDDAGEELDEVGGAEEDVGRVLYLDGFESSEFLGLRTTFCFSTTYIFHTNVSTRINLY